MPSRLMNKYLDILINVQWTPNLAAENEGNGPDFVDKDGVVVFGHRVTRSDPALSGRTYYRSYIYTDMHNEARYPNDESHSHV